MNSAISIRVDNLSKKFTGGLRNSGVQALAGVSFDVQRGEIFGLLGPNGAGKTTLVKILLGSLRPSSGTAFIDDREVSKAAARYRAGFLPENHRFPQYLTGFQMLRVFGGMTGMSGSQIKSRAGTLLELVGMSRWRNTRIKKYSKGMMQRLGLAQALINDPDIVFLDEPTDGVDPVGRREIRDILKNIKKQGRTVFLNSHLLSEVEATCDRVAVLDKGKLIKVGPASGLIGVKPTYNVAVVSLSDEVQSAVRQFDSEAGIDGDKISISMDKPARINDLIDLLRSHQVQIISVVPQKQSLEDSFMQLIQGERAGGQHE